MKKLTLLATSIMLVATFNANASVSETQEKRFQLSDKGQLLIENVNGDIDISSWSENSVLISAKLKADDQQDLDNIVVNMQQNGNRIIVETEFKNAKSGRHSGSGHVDYTIKVPSSIDLRDIDLVNGSLEVNDVRGELNVDIVNGSVTATGMAEDVEVDSVNGDVEVVLADTASDIEVQLETVNGNILLRVAQDFGATVEASTGNGRIKNDFSLQENKGQYYGTDLQGVIADGSSEVKLQSVNGSIKILKK